MELSPLRRLRFLWDRCDGARASRFLVDLDDGDTPNALVLHVKNNGNGNGCVSGGYQIEV